MEAETKAKLNQRNLQYNLPKLTKIVSFGPSKLHSTWGPKDNVEKG